MKSANIALKSDILSEIRVISTRLTPCRDTQNTRRRRRMYILSCKLLLLLLRFSVYLLPLLARRSLALARSLHAFIIVGGIGSGRKEGRKQEEEGRLRFVQRWRRTAVHNKYKAWPSLVIMFIGICLDLNKT